VAVSIEEIHMLAIIDQNLQAKNGGLVFSRGFLKLL
jgi:hypothetical protein